MKVLNKVVIGMASLVLLTACGPTKCSFEKFSEEARAAAEKDPEYKKVVVKGTVKANVLGVSAEVKLDHTFEKTDSGWEKTKGEDGAGAATALSYTAYRAVMFCGDEAEEDATYYCGGGFKVVGKNEDASATYVFDKYGYVTSVKGKAEGANVNVTVRWSK